jgi:hypothetical protein
LFSFYPQKKGDFLLQVRLWDISTTIFPPLWYAKSKSVTDYSQKEALLTLEHNHPASNMYKALVDVNLLLSTLKSHETQIGEWVNVIGYIERFRKEDPPSINGHEVRVQALVLWSSGPFNLEGYEKSLDRKIAESAPDRGR